MDDATQPDEKRQIRFPLTQGPPIGAALVTVRVANATFYIHEPLLRDSSDYFKAALSHDWKENQDREVTLTETTAEAFRMYSKWLYTGKLFSTKDGELKTYKDEKGVEVIACREWLRLEEVYRLADYLQDVTFKDAVIDSMAEAVTAYSFVPLRFASFIFPFSTKGSPHRKLVLDVIAHGCSLGNRESMLDPQLHTYENGLEFFQEFSMLVGKTLDKGITKVELAALFTKEKSSCHYHEHAQRGALCPRKMPRFYMDTGTT